MRTRNTIENLGLWEKLNKPDFKEVEFDLLLAEAGSNSFTLSSTKWVETTGAMGLFSKTCANGGTYVQNDIAIKFARWISVEFGQGVSAIKGEGARVNRLECKARIGKD